jgi:hypothetical protein
MHYLILYSIKIFESILNLLVNLHQILIIYVITITLRIEYLKWKLR